MAKSGEKLFALLLVPALLSGLAGCTGASDMYATGDDAPFYDDRVVAVRFIMAEEDWSYLKANAREESYVKADMWYDGELIPDIAVRPKGNSSLSSTISSVSIKFGLKADLNYFNSERNLDGVKKLNFNNGWSDPTFIKERLSYELFEAMEVPAPRSAFVDVWVNEVHLGLYTMVEQIDQSFLARYFTNSGGNLYKPEMPASYLNWTEEDYRGRMKGGAGDTEINLGGGNLADIMETLEGNKGEEDQNANKIQPGAVQPVNPFGNLRTDNATGRNLQPGFFPSANTTARNNQNRQAAVPNFNPGGMMGQAPSSDYLEQMGLKTNENKPNYSGLYRLLSVLNDEPDETFQQEIEKVLDVDQVLRYLAVSTALVHLDNYTGMGHNYYLYENQGRFTIIPWDLNMSFGGFDIGLTETGIINFLIDEPVTGAMSNRPLVARLLDVAEYRETYHGYLEQLIDGPFTSEVMNQRIDALADLVRPYVIADDLKFYSNQAFEDFLDEGSETGASSISRLMGMGMGLNAGLKKFIAGRIASIEKQLSGALPSTNNGRGNGIGMFFGGR